MKQSFFERNQGALARLRGEDTPKKSPDEMTIGELFSYECPNGGDHRLKDNGECDVCGDAPTVQQVAIRRQWLKDHPDGTDDTSN